MDAIVTMDAQPGDAIAMDTMVIDALPMDSGDTPDAGFPDADPIDTGPAPDSGVACNPTPRPPMPGDLLINEFFAAPANDLTGDANNDGTRDASDDEFVEIANVSNQAIALAGVVVGDATSVRHTFTARTLSCGQVVVVFGGGNVAHANWQPSWVIASSGMLSLNNTNDSVRVGSIAATPDNLATHSYAAEANNGQSQTRAVDLSPAAAFVAHSTLGGALFSPGRRTDGSSF